MCTSVARVAEHEDVAWHRVKDGLQWNPRVGAADDRCMRGLAQLYQLLEHPRTCPAGQCPTLHEAAIPVLQKAQGFLGLHRRVSSRANRAYLRPAAQGQCLRQLSEEGHVDNFKQQRSVAG